MAERLLLRLTLRRRCNQNEPWALRTERLSLRLILGRMRQRPLVLEHGAEITAIDPAIAGRTPDEVLGLAYRRIAEMLAEVIPIGRLIICVAACR